MTKIAVEQGLRPFHDALKDAGFIVVEMVQPEEVADMDAQAYVVSGMDQDFMGVQDSVDSPVISAAGRTPQEVVDEVRRSLGPRE